MVQVNFVRTPILYSDYCSGSTNIFLMLIFQASARSRMGIHLSYKIGAVQRISQRAMANARCKIGTYSHFTKKFTNIRLKGKKELCNTRAGPKSW